MVEITFMNNTGTDLNFSNYHSVTFAPDEVICMYLVRYNITWCIHIGLKTQMMKGQVYRSMQMQMLEKSQLVTNNNKKNMKN